MNITPTEHEEAVALADYLTLRGWRFSHIPQETFTKFWGTKIKNKQEGVHRGVPDYILFVPIKNGKEQLVFVELKRKKGSVTSPEQKEWINALNSCGCPSKICKGADEAIAYIETIAKSI